MVPYRFCCLLFAFAALSPGEDVEFFNVSRSAYDLGIVLPRNQFNEAKLAARLSAFASSQTTRHTLSRLSIASSEIDLRAVIPGRSLGFENPSLASGKWNQDLFAAQVLCINGMASAYLKFGNSVKLVQLLGNRDPRNLVVSGHLVRLVSFSIIGGGGGFDQLTTRGEEAPVELYVEAKPLLSQSDTEQLTIQLLRDLKLEKVLVVVRSDSLFGDFGGPSFDIFHPPFLNVQEAIYRRTPYVSCIARMKAGKTEQSCETTTPEQLRRSLWRK